jgi:hypothetical protein
MNKDYFRHVGGAEDGVDEACSSRTAGLRTCSRRVCPCPSRGWRTDDGYARGWGDSPHRRAATPVNWPPEGTLTAEFWENCLPPEGNLNENRGRDTDEARGSSPMGIGENGFRLKRKLTWGTYGKGWESAVKRTKGEPGELWGPCSAGSSPKALPNEEEMEVAPRMVEEREVPVETGSLTDEEPRAEITATWSEQEVETFVINVLLIMRSMTARMPTFPATTRVDTNIVSLFELCKPDDWTTATVPMYGRLVRAYLRPQGSLLASLLELDGFRARLRVNRPVSSEFNELTLDGVVGDEEPGTQVEEDVSQSSKSPSDGSGDGA